MDKSLLKVKIAKKRYEQYMPLNKAEKSAIERELMYKEIYYSNHIEGNEYTQYETQQLLEDDITAGNKSLRNALEIIGMRNALEESYCDIQDTITIDKIKQIHKALSTGVLPREECGNFKTSRNTIAGLTTASPKHVPIRMNKLLDWYNKLDKNSDNILKIATEFKYKFLLIHPFTDGNGRTSRILFNMMILNYGYTRTYVANRDKYYSVLQECNKTNSIESLYKFLCDCIYSTYEDLIDLLEK